MLYHEESLRQRYLLGTLPVHQSRTQTVVAVIDTGIDPQRLAGATVLPGINLSLEGSPDDTCDRGSHGTSVASTVLQMAPRTRLVPVKLMDRRGVLRKPADMEAAFDWILDHQASLEIGIVCAAFADASHATSDREHRDGRLPRQLQALREQGVATVAAAGNWHPEHRRRSHQGMARPAVLREVVSVGAVQRRPDGLWLTRGTQRLHATLGTGCSTTVFVEPGEPGETSGAAAVVAGCLAGLRRSHPDVPVDTLVQMLLCHRRDARDESGLAWPAVDLNTLPAEAHTCC